MKLTRFLKWISLIHIIGLLCLSSSLFTARGNNKESLQCQSKWVVPYNICTSSSCYLRIRLAEKNSIYVLSVYEWILHVFSADTTTHVQYNLLPYASIIGANADFIPLEDHQILFSGFDDSGFHFTFYNLATNETSLLEFEPDLNFNSCDSLSAPPIWDFQQLGLSSQIIACARSSSTDPDRTLETIHVLDIADQTASNPLITIWGHLGKVKPWTRVVGGKDGQVYISSSTNFLDSFIDTNNEFEYIFHKYPNEEVWHVIQIPLSNLTTWQKIFVDSAYQYNSQLIAVDKFSALYFYTSWLDNDQTDHIDIAKVDSQGNLIWQVNEQDLGATLLGINEDEQIYLIQNGDNSYLINQCELTPNSPFHQKIP